MPKLKRKSLNRIVEEKTNEENINAVLKKSKKPAKDKKTIRVSTFVDDDLDFRMREFINKRRQILKGYNLSRFIYEAIEEKITRNELA